MSLSIYITYADAEEIASLGYFTGFNRLIFIMHHPLVTTEYAKYLIGEYFFYKSTSDCINSYYKEMINRKLKISI